MELQTLTRIVGRHNALQLMLASADLRPAVRLPVEGGQTRAIFEVVAMLGLSAISGFDVASPRRVIGRGGYSEWAGRRSARAPDLAERRYVYAGHDKRHIELLRRADEAGDVCETGTLLGYPSCCVDRFSRSCAIQDFSSLPDPVLEHYNDKVVIPWQMNVSLLCYDTALITYVPCMQDCGAALVQADSFFNFLRSQDARTAAMVRRDLATMVVHTDTCGVSSFSAVELPEGGFRVTAIHYAMQESVVGSLMRVGNRVVLDDQYLTIGAFDFPGETASFFRFI